MGACKFASVCECDIEKVCVRDREREKEREWVCFVCERERECTLLYASSFLLGMRNQNKTFHL